MPRGQLGGPGLAQPAHPAGHQRHGQGGNQHLKPPHVEMLRPEPRPDRRRVLPVVRGAATLFRRLDRRERCDVLFFGLHPDRQHWPQRHGREHHDGLAVQHGREGRWDDGHGQTDGALVATGVGADDIRCVILFYITSR